jgi:predicted nucleotidyltransferase
MLTEGDIRRIAARVAAAYQPLAVGIFGSYAIGTATNRSDLDLFVIRKPGGAVAVDPRAVRRLLFGVLHPVDVQVFDPATFEASAHDFQSFTWVIARQALLYHWTPDAARLVPSLSSRHASQLSLRNRG